jgi:hypothetical protein
MLYAAGAFILACIKGGTGPRHAAAGGIAAGDKPPEFLAKVPSGLIPVIELNGRLMTESADIMRAIEDAFPEHSPLLPLAGTPERQRAEGLLRLERRLFSDWLSWLCSSWWACVPHQPWRHASSPCSALSSQSMHCPLVRLPRGFLPSQNVACALAGAHLRAMCQVAAWLKHACSAQAGMQRLPSGFRCGAPEERMHAPQGPQGR